MKTDIQTQQDVMAELKWEPSVNAAQIGVEVKDGVVTLVGHVQSFAEKWAAERAAQSVSGVKAIAVEMDVNLPGDCHRTDADIAQSVSRALEYTAFLPKDTVKVKVENGWVSLSGQVEWGYQKQRVSREVRYLIGVRGVSDNISIKPSVSSNTVKFDIEASLKRRAHADAEKISVAVHGSDVTLSGKVGSWSQRELAKNSAWGTPGVTNVVDNMTLAY
ncbi:MAG: BON domain-containing protein [Burkholderiaceae bacterium]|jgi:osmotically-inducible protein OsmY